MYRSDRVNEKLSELPLEKRLLLEKRLRGKNVANEKKEEPPQRDKKELIPLSFVQQRLWFINEFEDQSAAYHIGFAVRLLGHLQIKTLNQGFNDIARRHEALRTTFNVFDEQPRQTISDNFDVSISVKDVSHMKGAEKHSETSKIANNEFQRPFDLMKGPLFRISIVKSNTEDHLLIVTMHHIISDAWSIGILLRELATVYTAFSKGLPSPLSELTIQYADFAIQQLRDMNGNLFEKDLHYWKNKLAGAPDAINLPFDNPRPLEQTYDGRVEFFECEPELADKLKALTLETGGSLYITLLAAFIVLLHKYSGDEEILVGSPSANRNKREIEPLIGFFVNTLVVRADVDANSTFLNLLNQVRKTSIEAIDHQDTPFENIIEALKPKRNLSYNPLFQVMFVFQNAPIEPLKLEGLTTELYKLDYTTSLFDITLSMEEAQDRLIGFFEYNTGLFEHTTIERIIAHFKILLSSIANNPNQKISELTLITKEERHKMLVEWNDTKTSCAKAETVHQLFEDQTRRFPESIAVVGNGKSLTYKDLNIRANKLAHYLIKHMDETETLMGVCMERSVNMIISLLAILKSGSAYIPLDPNYPVERLSFMIEDSGLKTILVSKNNHSSLNDFPSKTGKLKPKFIYCDNNAIDNESDNNPFSTAMRDTNAYVIYTSGSTGQPKGVLIQQKSLLNFTQSAIKEYELHKGDNVLQFASLCFDASAEEIFPCLLSGGSLILRTDEMLNSMSVFLESCKHMMITVLDLPTAFWHELIVEMRRQNLKFPEHLRLIIIGGERANPKDLETLHQLPGDAPLLINTYGPTESTIVATSYDISNSSSYLKSKTLNKNSLKEVPIGRPIQNTRTYILDSYMQPTPIGVSGELHIGGEGVAKGYLNQTELTALKFIPDCFSNESDARLYKTGDLARYLPDGNIEFLGRIDHQVKIRGHRIEPGEIESVLMNLPEIEECVVVAREDEINSKQLIAYVTGNEPTIEIDRLRFYLKTSLPDYMNPSFFVKIDVLPITPSGKIDRNALPAPNITAMQNEFVGPETPTEELLKLVWQDVLNLETISVKDNFFETGGHSLLATQVVSRIREIFQVELSVRRIFEHPTIAKLGKAIDAMRCDKVTGKAFPIIEPAPKNKKLPLSFAQQRLWFLDRIEEQNPLYNIAGAMRLTGALDTNILELSINEVIRRHEILRTTFNSDEEKPFQVISSKQLLDLQIEERSEHEAVRACNDRARIPFDLSKGPLFRVCLFKTKPEEFILFIVMHHIISDGWSINILFEELSSIFTSYSNRKPSPLKELSIQYSDFALWQRERLKNGEFKNQIDYWKCQLLGAPPILEIPTDRPRPLIQTHNGDVVLFEIDCKLTKKLKALSIEKRASLFMTLHTTFAILLARYSGQDDIVVGSPIANRNNKQIESLMGFFVNMVALRTNLSGQPSFSDILSRVRETTLDAYAHQDAPFELLVEEINPERDMSCTPLFQVMFTFQNTPKTSAGKLMLPGVTAQPIELINNTAKFDLSLIMEETDNSIAAAFEYNSDLFNKSSIQKMAEHFKTLLSSVTAKPDQMIFDLPLITKEENHEFFARWNEEKTCFQSKKSVHQLFEEQAKMNPDTIAVVCDENQLTYGELNRKANQLANYLLDLKTNSNSCALITGNCLIGICIDRSLDMVLGVLAILKAGCAYVPLDPYYPAERLQFMIDDSQTPLLLSQGHLKEKLPEYHGKMVSLDKEWDLITTYSDKNLAKLYNPDHLAYVIYTSGSTGKPKGCMVTHHNVIRLFDATKELYNFSQRDVWTLFHSYAFDFSVWEMYGALLHGGKLIIVPYVSSRDIKSFYKLLMKHKVTVLNHTPSAFKQLIQVCNRHDDLALRLIIFGGESLDFAMLRPWFTIHGDQQPKLFNMYGITETTVHVTHHQIDAIQINNKSVIGKPVTDLQLFLLEPNHRPVPAGMRGEIYVGGAGVTPGYLNQPGFTAEKFMEIDLFGKRRRLYKTGDMGRYLPDGNNEYMGRIDNQVKIRGFRIELGEIESVLSQHPNVRENCLIKYKTIKSDNRLAAFVVPHNKNITDINELREFLKKHMPDYMIPASITFIDSIPLTQNNKIDSQTLQKQAAGCKIPEEILIAPQSPEEEILATIWSDLLETDRVGLNDNFFELGGHSLLATQVISGIRETFKIELPLRSLFESPTIAGLAKQLNAMKHNVLLPTIQPVNRAKPLPLSFAQQRLWFLHQLEGPSSTYNIPIVLRIKSQLCQHTLEKSFQTIAQRHEILRACFPKINGRPTVRISNEDLKLNNIDLTLMDTEEREQKAMQLATNEAVRSFDIETGPLFRIGLIKLERDTHILIVTMHHIISDGWSIGILIRELSSIYQSILQNTESQLQPLPIQYVDYAVWQRKLLKKEDIKEQLNYWKKQLAGAPTLLALPTDKPRPFEQSFQGASLPITLSPELTSLVKSLSAKSGVTLFMTLLAAFAVLLRRYSNQKDIVIGTPIANRTHSQTESLIGFFVNTLALRLDLSKDPTFENLLQQTKQVALDAYSHQEASFEQVVEELNPERSLSHSPLFQVMFVLQNVPMPELALPELKTTPIEISSNIAQFDLTLSLSETADGLTGELEFNADLFKPCTINRMIEHFKILVSSLANNAQQSVVSIQFLTQTELRQLSAWNNTTVERKTTRTIMDLFEEQVDRTPQAIAVCFEDKRLTYRELNMKSNQLASYLQSLGVKSESIVAVCLNRSINIIIGLLAIIKADGVYAPLDLDYPEERINQILSESGTTLFLTQTDLKKRVSTITAKVVCLDETTEDLEQYSPENLVRITKREHLAYVIYTSGSTGQPKGVMIEQGSFTSHCCTMQSYLQLNSNDRVLQFSSLNFDASLEQIFTTLISGASIILRGDQVWTIPEFNREIIKNKITVADIPTAYWRQWVNDKANLPEFKQNNHLRLVIVGGDTMDQETVQAWLNSSFNSIRLINAYGPTEATITTTVYEIYADNHKKIELQNIPIG